MTQVVTEERTLREEHSLSTYPDQQLLVFLQSPAVGPRVREAIQTAMQKHDRWTHTQQDVANVQRDLNAVKADQPRLRSNLERIPLTDPLAKRILEKLNAQETGIERYEQQLAKLSAKAEEERNEYAAFLAGLNVE